MCDLSGLCVFYVFSADKLPVFSWSRAQFQVDFVAIAARLLFEVNYEFMNGSSHFQPCLNLYISKYILLREEVREKKISFSFT